MTLKGKVSLLFLLTTLAGCKTRNIRKYFNAPEIPKETIVNECTGFQAGELVDITNFIAISAPEYNALKEYFEDKEYRLYTCLKFKKRCK